MHVRFSTARGTPFVEEDADEAVGWLSQPLINPDTGVVEGFFVEIATGFGTRELFCGKDDIVRWGTSIAVRDRDIFAPADDRLRLHDLLADPRRLLGQTIRTETGHTVGICRDVQINTDTMKIEWLFPKKWLRWGVAIPVTEVIEVKPEAIIIKDQMVIQPEKIIESQEPDAIEALQEITDPPIPQPTRSAS